MPVFLISVQISEANILTEFEGTIPPTTPEMDPLNTNFFNDLS